MKSGIWFGGMAAAVFLSGNLSAQAPPGATGQCKDGTYSTAASKAGACSGHKGVQSWFASDKSPSGGSKVPSATYPAATVSSAAPEQRATPVQSSNTPLSAHSTTGALAGAGGPGLVWVNTSSKVYHCYGGPDYGTTKAGKYESEASAKAEGARPARGKVCGQ